MNLKRKPTSVAGGVGEEREEKRQQCTLVNRQGTPHGRPFKDVEPLLAQKRLVLVLDLDHTLLHSTYVHNLSPSEAYLLQQGHPVGDGRSSDVLPPVLYNMEGTLGILITKLRPLVHTFLREVSPKYHLCICTMGNRAYAGAMVRILDPNGRYFSDDDIFSRSDFPERGKKGLDVLGRGDERTTVVLDDTEAAWEKHPGNLILVPPYHYFAAGLRKSRCCTGRSLAERGEDEDEMTGALARALSLLRCVHSRFFSCEGEAASRDVRETLKDVSATRRGGSGAGSVPRDYTA